MRVRGHPPRHRLFRRDDIHLVHEQPEAVAEVDEAGGLVELALVSGNVKQLAISYLTKV